MSKTFNVTLPRDQRPLFPRTCIVCGCLSPRSRVRVSTADSKGSFLKRQLGNSKPKDHPFSTDAPACRLCVWKFRMMAYGGWLLAIVVGAVLFFFGDELQRHFPGRRGPGIALLLATSPIWILWLIFFKEPLAVIPVENEIEFRFTSEKFRDEFASINSRSEPAFDSVAQTDVDDDNPFQGMQL